MSLGDLETRNVEMSIGLTLVVSQSNWRLSRKRDRLAEQARLQPLSDPDDQLFAETFYPLLAAAVVSDNCPTVEECLQRVPEGDLELWYSVTRQLNPQWFSALDAVAELLRQEDSADMETKKEQMMSLLKEEKTPAES